MNRKHQQAELIFKTGQWLGPVLKVLANPETYDSDERTRIQARIHAEGDAFRRIMIEFMNGEPGHSYNAQMNEVLAAMGRIFSALPDLFARALIEKADADKVTFHIQDIPRAITSVPIPIESAI